MPSAVLKPCNKAGCGALATINGYCDQHQTAKREAKNNQDKQRGSASSRGYGHKWRLARSEFLANNPLCVTCLSLNKVEAARVVDHIVPHKLSDAIASGNKERIAKAYQLFWRRSNWQALCIVCHNRKTATYDM